MNYDDLFIESKLPNPLNNKELIAYFEKMRAGNKLAGEIIIRHNIKLVLNQVLKKFGNSQYEKKELVSIGLIGLVKGVDTFDISKDKQFSTYATRCIDNEILMFMRKGKKYSKEQSLDTPLGSDKDGNDLTIAETLSDETADFVAEYERKESIKIIRELVNELEGREKEIIMLYFGFYDDKQYTQEEIANIFDISRAYVQRLIQNTLNKLTIKLNQKGIVEKNINGIITVTRKHCEKKKGKEKMAKQLQSIYEYFKNYSREQIDDMLLKLTDEERKLITLRYGDDLDNPISSSEWNTEYQNKFYGSLLPKMKRLLANPEHKRKPRTSRKLKQVKQPIIPTEEIEQEQPIISTEETKQEQPINVDNDSSMSKEDYIKIFKNSKFWTINICFNAKRGNYHFFEIRLYRWKIFFYGKYCKFFRN